MERDRFEASEYVSMRLRLNGNRKRDWRQYNLRITFEIVVLIVGDGKNTCRNRYIIIEEKGGGLKRIT